MDEDNTRESNNSTPSFGDINQDESEMEGSETQNINGDKEDRELGGAEAEPKELSDSTTVPTVSADVPQPAATTAVVSKPSGLVPAEFGLEVMSQDLTVKPKRERSNAKPVECLDMDGNLIQVYKSGALASQALNIQQGDISLCCRGLKKSVMGYRFRFFGDTVDRLAMSKLKKGFGLVLESELNSTAKPETTRSTRASRGEYGAGQPAAKVTIQEKAQSILAPKEVKVRLDRLTHDDSPLISFCHCISFIDTDVAASTSESRSLLGHEVDSC